VPRLPRYAAPGFPQHVIQRGNNRCACFAVDSDYRFFRDCLASACEKHGCRIHAYVLMTNHSHLLMTPSTETAIGHFNSAYQRTGTLWEGRYKATVIETESYLFACYRYIELNPVRAGLVENPRAYRWSSHGANAFGERDSLVSPHEVYTQLGRHDTARQAVYRGFFDIPLEETTVTTIRDATEKGWALGSKKFRQEIAALVGRRTEAVRAWQSGGNAENGA
jgi:REP-associated tyrosine transposase